MLFLKCAYADDDYIHAQAAIQITSGISDGRYTISDIVDIAKNNGIDVIVITDRTLMKWQYGLWPLRGIVKKTVENNSILKHGAKKYLKEIEDVQRVNPDVVVIAGTKCSPFYYWEGSPLANTLKIFDWHKNLLVVGFDKAADLEKIPIVGNKRASINFDQYKGDRGIMPFQNLIDYGNSHSLMTFWAQPEASYIDKVGVVAIETKEFTEDLLWAHDYTGFTIFYNGYEKVGRPGGIWDRILNEYCEGKRSKPIWAISGLSYDFTGKLADVMNDLRTVLFVHSLSKREVLDAIRAGRMYVANGSNAPKFILNKFVAQEQFGKAEAMMGEELKVNAAPRINISGLFLEGSGQPIKLNLIRNGESLKVFDLTSPFDITCQDDGSPKGCKFYYRVEITAENLRVVSNPIFVRRE